MEVEFTSPTSDFISYLHSPIMGLHDMYTRYMFRDYHHLYFGAFEFLGTSLFCLNERGFELEGIGMIYLESD